MTFVGVHLHCCLQDMMKQLDYELRSSQGTIGELNTAITDVSIRAFVTERVTTHTLACSSCTLW